MLTLPAGGDDLNLNPPFLTNGIQAVRVFDPLTRKIELVAELDRGRWYASVMTMADGNLLVLGGVQQVGSWPPLPTLVHMTYCRGSLCARQNPKNPPRPGRRPAGEILASATQLRPHVALKRLLELLL